MKAKISDYKYRIRYVIAKYGGASLDALVHPDTIHGSLEALFNQLHSKSRNLIDW